MDQLILQRRRRDISKQSGQTAIKIDADSYNKVLEIADETGESLREIVSKMVDFAFEHVVYET